MIKNPPVMQETEVRSMDREDSLEEDMATHSSILAWRIPWTGTWEATVHGSQRVKRTQLKQLSKHTHKSEID